MTDEIQRAAWRPDQDPTALTNELVGKATKYERELTETRISGVVVRVEALQALHEEKFSGVGTRFNELNTRLTEGDRYKQTALDAALKAAQTLVDIQNLNFKETIKKTEELFGKQIDGLQQTVDDLKGLVRQGSAFNGGSNSGQTALIGWFIAAIMALIAVGAVVGELHH